MRTCINKKQLNKPDKYLSYVLGLLWADGYLRCQPNCTAGICIEILKKDADVILSNFKKTGHWTINYRHRANRQDTTILYSSDKSLIEILKKCDYLFKKTASADKILQYIGEGNLKYWLAGLIDGDGCLYVTRQSLAKLMNKNWLAFTVSVYSTISQDWSYLINVMEKLKINYKISKRIRNSGQGSEFILYGASAAKFCRFIYHNIHLPVLDRKKQKYEQYIKGQLP